MESLKQPEANRLNSKRSTGPRSVEGKAASSMNALKSGIDAQSHIIPGEDAVALEALTVEYLQRFLPTVPEERVFVDILIRDDWQLRRLNKVEAQLWQYRMEDLSHLDEDSPLGHVFHYEDKEFSRLQRRLDATERSYRNALLDLERLQSARRAAAEAIPDPPPPPQPVENKSAPPKIGFVVRR